MLTTLSITSRSQGQIYGAKPTLEDIERQLEADPMTGVVNRCARVLALLVSSIRSVKLPGIALESAKLDTIASGK